LKIDVMCSGDYGHFNIEIANLFGLDIAIYLDELINQCRENVKSGKVGTDGFFKVVRKRVLERTTFPQEKQLVIDDALIKLKIIDRAENDSNNIRIDLSTLLEYLNIEKTTTKKTIQEIINSSVNKDNIEKEKVSIKISKDDAKKARILESLHTIVAKDFSIKVKEAFYDWMGIIYDTGRLNQSVVEEANKAVISYAQGNEKRAIDFLTYASVNSYHDLRRAVEWYKSSMEKDSKNKPFVSPTKSITNSAPIIFDGGETF